MIINRHNYEEFFLLYVDNELGAEEQQAVEAFVGQNSDLANELEVLKQITLADENVEFTQKDLLYKNESGISLSDYEEYFLLFADKELSGKEAAEVERFVLKHPQLQDEFTLLQKVRLQPEPVVFAGKHQLYRKKENERRVILLRLSRLSVAAVIAGAFYISFIFYSNNKSSYDTAIHVANPHVKKGSVKNDSSLSQKSMAQETEAPSPHKIKRKKDIEKVVAQNIKPEKSIPKKFIKVKKQEETIADIKVTESQKVAPIEEKNFASLEKAPREQQPAEEEFVTESDDNSNFNISNQGSKENTVFDKPVAAEEKPIATHAVYLETDDVEQEKTLYIGSARLNKNKVKGLFKKAANFLDKKLRGSDN